ncbi:MAG: DUF1704 domain-containing protein [Caldilineaceae bacterium]
MHNMDFERFRAIDLRWQNIEQSYRIEPYTAPTNLELARKSAMASYASGVPYSPVFEYAQPPDFPVRDIYEFIKTLRFEDSLLERIYYFAAQQELLSINAVQTHSPSVITGQTALAFGIPSDNLVNSAKAILASVPTNSSTSRPDEVMSAENTAVEMQKLLGKCGLEQWSATTFSPMSAKVSVNRLDKMIKIREHTVFSSQEIRRLFVHEIGVHVFRSENGARQPLGIFGRGLPGYLDTEEGLAVLVEEKAGVSDPATMRKYAARVVGSAVALNQPFSEVFGTIAPDVGPEAAFEIASRAKRGFRDTSEPGAHTKDIVYLKGYLEVKKYVDTHPEDFEILWAGKYGLTDIGWVKQMIEDSDLKRPLFVHMPLI